MAKTWGMNIPPELARDVGHVFERRVGNTSGVIGSRRGGSGIIRGGREELNQSFLESITCWHMQTQAEKESWYRQSQIAGMRYYNYFMSKTIGEFFNGHVPDWCKELDNGLLQIPGISYENSDFFDPSILAAGKRVFLEMTLAWSNLKPNDYIYINFYVLNDNYSLLQAYISVEGASSCGTFTESENSDPGFGDYTKRGDIAGPSSLPVTFTLNFNVPSFYDLSNILDARIRISSDFFDVDPSAPDIPVVWLYSYSCRIGTEFVVENNFSGEDLEPVKKQTDFTGEFIARPDPWVIWDFPYPVCNFGGA